jgi:hypothetical protein
MQTVFAPLTAPEQTRLSDAEGIIERGFTTFVEVGSALAVIREQRLYRATHETFDLYCRERWGWTKRRASQLITSAAVVLGLAETGTVVPKPTNEWQARALGKVAPGKRIEVWQQAVDASPNGKPTSKDVERAARPDEPEEPEPPDPIAEWERAELELASMRELAASLQADDTAAELTKLHRKYRSLDARLAQALTTLSAAEKTAKYAQGLLARIRKSIGVERDAEIIAAIDDLRR